MGFSTAQLSPGRRLFWENSGQNQLLDVPPISLAGSGRVQDSPDQNRGDLLSPAWGLGDTSGLGGTGNLGKAQNQGVSLEPTWRPSAPLRPCWGGLHLKNPLEPPPKSPGNLTDPGMGLGFGNHGVPPPSAAPGRSGLVWERSLSCSPAFQRNNPGSKNPHKAAQSPRSFLSPSRSFQTFPCPFLRPFLKRPHRSFWPSR